MLVAIAYPVSDLGDVFAERCIDHLAADHGKQDKGYPVIDLFDIRQEAGAGEVAMSGINA